MMPPAILLKLVSSLILYKASKTCRSDYEERGVLYL